MKQTHPAGLTRSEWTRRKLLKRAVGSTVALSLFGRGPEFASAEGIDGVELPPDLGQTPLQVFVPETGHTVGGTFLDYWRANGAASVIGNPVTEPFAAPNGFYSQAFERGILQYRPEFVWSDDPIVRFMPIHTGQVPNASAGLARTGRRAEGGGNRRSPAWRPLSAESKSVSRAIESGGLFFEETGHTLKGSFLDWYSTHEGHFYIGHPVSEAYTDGGALIQYFEGGMLVENDDGVRLASLDRSIIRRLDIDTRAVEQQDLPIFDEVLFWDADNPNPLGDTYAPGRKRIEVSVTEQRLWAYQGETLITSTLVSTGISPNDTELGMFHLRLKYPEQDMQGFTDDTGEVLGFGEAPPGTIPYGVKDVPDVMYFNFDAEALHGTYWHDNFGQRMSHGCVNLPLDFAAFLYGWAPLGTLVWVYE